MSLSKPFFRIIRPSLGDNSCQSRHILDDRYAPDRGSLISAYHLLEKDFIKLLDYIEPTDKNLSVYSHRIYEQYLRAATEFEANCTAILFANDYPKKKNLKIEDFYKINKVSRLNEYQIRLYAWTPIPKIIEPFADWQNTITFKPLKWYQDYNSVKHNRNKNFELANFENLIKAISGVFVILFSQFYVQAFFPYHEGMFYRFDDDRFIYDKNNLFSIKPVQSWDESERYSFNWEKLKSDHTPFDKCKF